LVHPIAGAPPRFSWTFAFAFQKPASKCIIISETGSVRDHYQLAIIGSGSGGSEAVSLAARNGFAYCVDAPFRDLFAKFASFSMHVRLAESKKSIAPPLESTGSIGSPYANLSAKWPRSPDHQAPNPRQSTFQVFLGSLAHDRRLRSNPDDPQSQACGSAPAVKVGLLHRFIVCMLGRTYPSPLANSLSMMTPRSGPLAGPYSKRTVTVR
jgi:hypothetical protein